MKICDSCLGTKGEMHEIPYGWPGDQRNIDGRMTLDQPCYDALLSDGIRGVARRYEGANTIIDYGDGDG